MRRSIIYSLLGLMLVLNCAVAQLIHKPNWSPCEQAFLEQSTRKAFYPDEKIAILEVSNPYNLGKLLALRFLEWVDKNPQGVISLDTNNIMNYFISYLNYYKINWQNPNVQADLKSHNINLKKFPDTTQLKFVQQHEIYPVSPEHSRNQVNIIKNDFLDFLGISPDNALLMDIARHGILRDKGIKVVFMNGRVDSSLLTKKASTQLEYWQQKALREAEEFCEKYEKKVHAWGGIGFYVGSLGFGDNLAYNLAGSASNSKTRLVPLDYMAASEISKDVGGYENAKNKLALTIGLKTLKYNKDIVAIVLVSGEVRAKNLQNLAENYIDNKYPATALQSLANSRVYATSVSTYHLGSRTTEQFLERNKNDWNFEDLKLIITEVSLSANKQILMLEKEDFAKHKFGKILIENYTEDFQALLQKVHDYIAQKIYEGSRLHKTTKNNIMHTAPHHDDLVLGYYPLIKDLYRQKNSFVYLTSGYNSVTNNYLLSILRRTSGWWIDTHKNDIFYKPYSAIIKQFKPSYIRNDLDRLKEIEMTIALKAIVNVFSVEDSVHLKETIRWLKDIYFAKKRPGDEDIPQIKRLKGMMRESESDRVWSLERVKMLDIYHLRSKFYNNHSYENITNYDSDVEPIEQITNKINPDVITIPDDPVGIRPTTNYLALQSIARMLESYIKEKSFEQLPKIWGYRNIWFKYHVNEANIMVPVSQRKIDSELKIFDLGFNTQNTNSFPIPLYDAKFSEISTMLQQTQRKELGTLLGEDFFKNNKNKSIKNSVGFIFMKEMTVAEFISRANILKRNTSAEELST